MSALHSEKQSMHNNDNLTRNFGLSQLSMMNSNDISDQSIMNSFHNDSINGFNTFNSFNESLFPTLGNDASITIISDDDDDGILKKETQNNNENSNNKNNINNYDFGFSGNIANTLFNSNNIIKTSNDNNIPNSNSISNIQNINAINNYFNISQPQQIIPMTSSSHALSFPINYPYFIDNINNSPTFNGFNPNRIYPNITDNNNNNNNKRKFNDIGLSMDYLINTNTGYTPSISDMLLDNNNSFNISSTLPQKKRIKYSDNETINHYKENGVTYDNESINELPNPEQIKSLRTKVDNYFIAGKNTDINHDKFGKPGFICQWKINNKICGKWCEQKGGIQHHIFVSKDHMNVREFFCSVCGKALGTKQSKQLHEKAIHGITRKRSNETRGRKSKNWHERRKLGLLEPNELPKKIINKNPYNSGKKRGRKSKNYCNILNNNDNNDSIIKTENIGVKVENMDNNDSNLKDKKININIDDDTLSQFDSESESEYTTCIINNNIKKSKRDTKQNKYK